jgi:hypothetical protein
MALTLACSTEREAALEPALSGTTNLAMRTSRWRRYFSSECTISAFTFSRFSSIRASCAAALASLCASLSAPGVAGVAGVAGSAEERRDWSAGDSGEAGASS